MNAMILMSETNVKLKYFEYYHYQLHMKFILDLTLKLFSLGYYISSHKP